MLFLALLLLAFTIGLNYKNIGLTEIFFRLQPFGAMVPHFAHWSIGSFLHPYESNLPFAPVLTTRIIRALPFTRRHCPISIAETQTFLQALRLLVLTTHYTIVEPVWCLQHTTQVLSLLVLTTHCTSVEPACAYNTLHSRSDQGSGVPEMTQ